MGRKIYRRPKRQTGFQKYVSVENIFDVSTDTQLWYAIPGFNGYEISDKGYLRSMKHYKQYPFGILLKPVKGTTDIFELSDNNNERVKINIARLYNIAMNSQQPAYYPRGTCTTLISSRNQSIFIKRKPNPISKETFFPSFSVIKDIDMNDESNKICPIYFK